MSAPIVAEAPGAPGDDTPAPGAPGDDTPVPGRPSAWRRALPWLGDAHAAAVLTAVWWYWAAADGGYPPFAAAVAGVVALVGLPFLVATAATLPRTARLLLVMWGVGALLSFAFALDRSRWIPGMLGACLIPLVALAALRVWRRPWGPPFVAGLLLLAFGRSWYHAFLAWWGHLLAGDQSRWLALSWHNQSGMLMGVGVLLFGGLALTGRRVVAVCGGLVAAACAAAVVLSGSRGALAATAIGGVVLVVAAVLSRGWRRVLAGGAPVAVAAVAIGALLLGMAGGYASDGNASDPLTGRDENAATNFGLRLHHMRTGVRLFVDRPLVGQGPGAYAVRGIAFTDPNANLTSSAHNEYIEMFAEGGIPLGVAFAGGSLLVALLVPGSLRRLRDASRDQPPDELRLPLAVGACGAVTALLLHAAIDFDWGYPILPSMLALSAVVLFTLRERDDPSDASASVWAGAAVAVPLAVALALPAAGAMYARVHRVERGLPPAAFAVAGLPWDSDSAETVALQLAADGHVDDASTAVDRVLLWNPGDLRLQAVRTLVDHHAGRASDADVVAAVERRGVPLYMRVVAAEVLAADGSTEQARGLLERGFVAFERHRRWSPDVTVGRAWLLLIDLDGREHGCARARATAAHASEDPLLGDTAKAAAAAFEEAARVHC